jgi:hypothetical protein
MPAELRALFAHLGREAQDPWKVLRLSLRIGSLCFALALILSRDMWFQDDRLYLPSPVLPWLALAPHWLNGLLYSAMLGCCTLLFCVPRLRRIGFLIPPIFIFLFLQDQLRAQFYLYMAAFNILVAAALPKSFDEKDLDPLRYMTIGIYFWAGFYKLNLYFMQTLLPWFISPWFPFHDAAQVLGAVTPFIESAIGLCLLFPTTRWIGQLLAMSMVAGVLVSLGPFGHNLAAIVWAPNVYIDCLALFLFMDNKRSLLDTRAMKRPLTALSIGLFVLVPALGMTPYLGPHPSFKLYCACTPDAELEIGAHEQLRGVPEAVVETLADNRLNATLVTHTLYRVAAPTLVPGDQPYIDSMKGFCPYLTKPQDARLHVLETKHFWSMEIGDHVYDICAEKPRLLSGGE